jgi:predicted short-subunit dehydrogenase-like oxidoreductase (DUF2520 family)
MDKSFSVTLIGSGNMAYCLGEALLKSGRKIQEVCSRNKKTGKILAKKLNTTFTNNLLEMNIDSSLYVICVSDQSIEEVATHFPFTNKIIVHTSGVTPLSVFKNKFKNCGVIYPVQSITKGVNYDWQKTPFCIEASNSSTLTKIKAITRSLSKQVLVLNSEQRMQVHLAAVYANNFTNVLYSISELMLDKKKIPFKILNSLILNTAEKAIQNGPLSSQTGPARRNDLSTIKKHLLLLKDDKEEALIYSKLTSYIQKVYKN